MDFAESTRWDKANSYTWSEQIFKSVRKKHFVVLATVRVVQMESGHVRMNTKITSSLLCPLDREEQSNKNTF